MGRASAGGGGGHSHSSSGGGGRSHSSHSFSSGRSSRSSGGFSGGSSDGYSRPPRRYRRGYGGGRSSFTGSSAGCMGTLIVLIFIVIIAITLMSLMGSGADVPKSTADRQPLNTAGIGYNADCVEDNIGWLSGGDIDAAGDGLRYFWEETGVQPYVVLMDYSEDWDEPDEQSAYADDFYDTYIADETTLLVIYFNDKPGDAGGWGNWEAVKGQRVDAVMDNEAMSIFWAYLDSYWYGDYSEEEVIVNTFTDTADRIMTRTRTAADVAMIAGIVVLALVIVVGIIAVMKTRRRHEKEKAAETERILNTPLEEIKDPTLEKYAGDAADDAKAPESGDAEENAGAAESGSAAGEIGAPESGEPSEETSPKEI